MATSHGITVVKNLCYTAPRNPKTKLPTSENERTLQSTSFENTDYTEKQSSSRDRGTKIHTPKAMLESLKELQSADEKDFYKHLVALKKEHKKTLKHVENMYYSEVQRQHHGFDIDEQTRITVDDDSVVKTAQTIRKDYNPFKEGYEELLETDLLPTTDLVRDMSVNEHREDKENQDSKHKRRSHSDLSDDSWSEDEIEAPRKRTQSSEGRVLYKEMLPNRSTALDTVESLWKDFSVYDYPYESSSPSKSVNKQTDTWSPSITIPKPFTMTTREAKKSKDKKSRSQRLLEEDLKKKKEQEESELQKKFRSQPIPATTFLPLYDEINRQNEVRRQYVKETSKALLRSSERPFSFMEREDLKRELTRSKSLSNLSDFSPQKENKEFKANPFPAHLFDLTLADKLAEQEEYRAIKVRMRAQETLANSRLPTNMEGRGRQYTIGKLRNKAMKEKAKKAFMTKDHTFRPQINHDIPDFDMLQYEFDKELRHKKKEREPTVVEPFQLRTAIVSESRKSRSLTKRSTDSLLWKSTGRSNSRERPSGARSLSRERPSSARPSSRERPVSAALSYSSDTLPFGTTESTRLRESKIRQSLKEQRTKEKDDETEQRRKHRRLKQLRPEVSRKAMANDNSWHLRRTADVKIKSYREAEKARREEYLQELEDMQSRVDKRPLLFERQSQLNAKRTAERKYEDILRSAGVDEQTVRSLVTKNGKIIDAESEDDQSDEDDTYSKHLTDTQQYYKDDYSDTDDDDIELNS